MLKFPKKNIPELVIVQINGFHGLAKIVERHFIYGLKLTMRKIKHFKIFQRGKLIWHQFSQRILSCFDDLKIVIPIKGLGLQFGQIIGTDVNINKDFQVSVNK